MAFTVKYVPISPGMYNQTPQTKFPDFDSFVPLSQDLLNASKHLEDLMREISYLGLFSDEQPLPSINMNTSIAAQNFANLSGPVAGRDFTEYLSYFQPDCQAESNLLPVTNESLDFDMDTTPLEGVDPDFLPWSITEEVIVDPENWSKSSDLSSDALSELEALISSMDSSKLEAMQQSFDEFEREFFGEAPSASNE